MTIGYIFGLCVTKWQTRAAVKQLLQLDDHILNDIGIDRGSIMHHVRRDRDNR